ncbi:MAG: hypothetical protein ACYC55_00330 [Candidatus Geothermincolia bacterium]
MATTLRFVEADLTTLRLALNWIEGESDLTLPEHMKQWAESPHADGRRYVNGHWGGRTLHLALQARGSSKVERNSKARALVAELIRENILELDDGTNPIWIKTYPLDAAQATGVLERWLESEYMLHPLVIDLPADPHWFGDWETLSLVSNKVDEWSFEDYTGSGNTTNFTGWTETRTNGAGTATVEAHASAAVFGAVGCHLKVTSVDGVASVESGYMSALDAGVVYHHFLGIHCFRVSGADALTVTLRQFDGAFADLNDDIILTPAGAAAWRFASEIVGAPGTLPAPAFHADCENVKLLISVDGAVADWYVDGVGFTSSRYLSGYELTNALGVILPGAEGPTASVLLGDVPAPCDIYIGKWGGCEDTKALYLGGRKVFHHNFVARLENSQGTAALSNLASGGAFRTQTVPTEKLTNGGFNTFTGVAGSDAEVWTDWTATRGAGAELLIAYPWGEGGYCVAAASNDGVLVDQDLTRTAAVAIDIGEDHVLSVYYAIWQASGLARFKVDVLCFDAGNNPTGTLEVFNVNNSQLNFAFLSRTIAPAEWPALTTKGKAKLTFTTKGGGGDDVVFGDLISFAQSSVSLAGLFETYSDYIKGDAKLLLHYKLSTAETDKTLTVQGKITDDSLGDISALQVLESLIVDMPDDWTYQELSKRKALPTSRIPDAADTSALEQFLEVDIDSSLTGGETVSIDDLAILPIDNGYAEIPAESNQYLIIDCNSDFPAVLQSLDGTIDTATQYSEPGALRRVFEVDPQNGTNLGFLMDFRDASNNAMGQWNADVHIRYRPLYLLVK